MLFNFLFIVFCVVATFAWVLGGAGWFFDGDGSKFYDDCETIRSKLFIVLIGGPIVMFMACLREIFLFVKGWSDKNCDGDIIGTVIKKLDGNNKTKE